MNTTEQFEQLISEVVQERTFSLEAVEKIKALKQSHEELAQEEVTLKEEIVDLKEKVKELKEYNKGLNESESFLLEQLKEWEKREKELIERENKFDVTDAKLECAKESKNDMMEMMRIVFRNPVAQRSVIQKEQKYDDYGNELYGQDQNRVEVITKDEVNPEVTE